MKQKKNLHNFVFVFLPPEYLKTARETVYSEILEENKKGKNLFGHKYRGY